MDLHSLVDRFARDKDVSHGYVYQIHLVVVNFAKHLGRLPMIADLNRDTVNGWIRDLTDSGLSRRSVRSKRNHLIALWNFGRESRLVKSPSRKIRTVKCPKLIPDASRPEKIDELLAKARALKGVLPRSRASRPAFWVAVVLVAWEAGLRLGDLLKLERSWIDERGLLTLVQNKTGDVLTRPLSPKCVAAVNAICDSRRKRVFGDCLSRCHVQKGMKRLLASVGLRGGLKRIRRSGATACHRKKRGSAQQYLGHRTPGLADEFYIDPRLLDDDPPTPPPLSG